MDWTNRDVKPNQAADVASAPAPGSRHSHGKHGGGSHTLFRIGAVIFLLSATILVVASIIYIAIGGKTVDESKYVDSKKMQAVFLNGGQVYFGNVTQLNGKFINLANIYYLRVNQSVQPADQNNANNISLVKLGCELHGPVDQMTINRDQVVFWENLKTDGQVAKAVAKYVSDNPGAQKCDTAATTAAPATTPAATTKK